MIRVKLYSRRDCGLCEETKDALHQLGHHLPVAVREIDIESDPVLENAYFDKIPVVEIGEERLFAPIEANELEAFVRRVGQIQ